MHHSCKNPTSNIADPPHCSQTLHGSGLVEGLAMSRLVGSKVEVGRGRGLDKLCIINYNYVNTFHLIITIQTRNGHV